MTNNDIIKKLRIALDLKDADMYEIFDLAEFETNKATVSGVFRKADNKNYKECSDEMLEAFLNGYIIYKRGPKPE